MKVKSLLLSMRVIAALAGCSRSNDKVPGGAGSDAPETKVILKLEGTGAQVASRAAGISGNLDAKNSTVSNLTVFVFNQSGLIITERYIDTPASDTNSISTTTNTKEVAVVTSTGDLATPSGASASVVSGDALKAVLSDVLVNPNNKTDAVTHMGANLYMSGMNDLGVFSDGGNGGQKATVTMPLRSLSARIQLKEITFNGGTATDNVYAQADDFATNADANFTITRVYLMSAQRLAHFLPAAIGGTDYITQGLKRCIDGIEWTAPWTDQTPDQFKPNNEYTIEAGTDRFIPGNGIAQNTISDIKHWYTFTNIGISDIANHPTTLVAEMEWRKVKADGNVSEESQIMYFTIYFGSGDKNEFEAGKAYTVSLKLNDNFKPTNQGGSGGSGTEGPTKPIVSSSVEITITPATWVLALEINKEWN